MIQKVEKLAKKKIKVYQVCKLRDCVLMKDCEYVVLHYLNEIN